MKIKLKALIYTTVFMITFVGCSSKTDIININYNAANKIIQNSDLDEGTIIIMSTIVDLNNVEYSLPLGRTISEQITTKFVNNGMNVIEMKLRDSVYIKEATGELILSRKINKLAKKVKAEAIVVGTYSNTKNVVYINLRIINPITNIIISTIDYQIPKDDNMKSLLKEN